MRVTGSPCGAPDDAALAAESTPTVAPIRETALGAEGESSFSNNQASFLPYSSTVDSSLSSTETQSEQRIELPCSKRRKWDSFDTSELERQNFMVEDVSDQPVSCSQTMEESQITHQAQWADGPQQPGVAGESSVKSIQDCWILEVFAGTASMVSAAAAAGMKRSVGLDHIRIAHRKGKVIQLDLLLDSHQSLLWKWLDSPGLAAVWIAPPCGKASRGLGLVEPGQTGTSPLNSPEHPEGKPDLAPRDAERVAKANLLRPYC